MRPKLTSMWHAHHKTVHTEKTGLIDDGLHGRYQHLAALQTETLFRDPFLGQKLLKLSGSRQSSQQQTLLISGQVHDARRFELLANPLALFQIVDEHVLHTDVLAVDVLQSVQDLTQGQTGLFASDESGVGQFENSV